MVHLEGADVPEFDGTVVLGLVGEDCLLFGGEELDGVAEGVLHDGGEGSPDFLVEDTVIFVLFGWRLGFAFQVASGK